jgi:leucyl-tRNA synthetase
LWQRLGQPYSIHQQLFPQASSALLESVGTVRVVVQVNGRSRGMVDLPADVTEADAVAAALQVDAARRALGECASPRVVYVPRRIVNLVTPSA